MIIETFNNADSDADEYACLRLVELEDLPPLEILEMEVFLDLAYSMPLLRMFYNMFQATWHVAEHNGDLAGYALVGPSSNRTDGWLLGLAVGNRHRGHGLGRKLMNRALLSMMEHDVTDAYLAVRRDNNAARSLYSNYEFVQQGEAVPNFYDSSEPRRVLYRSLQDNPYLGDR